MVLGYDTPVEYEAPSRTFFGVTVGRNANRIAGGRFTLNGKTYQIDQNQNGNNLHSGEDFYSFRVWDVKEIGDNCITFALHSPDEDQGYPGAVDIEVKYILTDDNAVQIDYFALPQYYPNAINQENFQSPIVRKSEEYRTRTVYKFV